jgi:hypothetical protein
MSGPRASLLTRISEHLTSAALELLGERGARNGTGELTEGVSRSYDYLS